MLTQEFAAKRSQQIVLHEQRVHVDLSRAGDRDIRQFAVISTLKLTSTKSEVCIDAKDATDISVRVNGVAVPFQYLDSVITLSEIPTDTETLIEIAAKMLFSKDGQGMHRTFDATDGSLCCYTHFEPNAAHRAWPCLDQPDIKTIWHFSVDAPADWTVLSNQAENSVTESGNEGIATHTFLPTPPLSPYLCAVAAGDLVLVAEDEYVPADSVSGLKLTADPLVGESVTTPRIQMRVFARPSLASAVEGEFINKVTVQCLDFYHERYRYAYPWGKYDQIFMPEYNIGAMENPGLITFNESYIKRGKWSDSERLALASTIAHEMCHMWFGDLVTPKWWDDLWLKESFADHESYAALEEGTDLEGSWASFACERKSFAYRADLGPTTHPIAATIPDVAAAFQNFDGITYAKGAAVVKQLVACVGADKFVMAVRDYFAENAYGCATMPDLMECLSRYADLTGWEKPWLRVAGPSLIDVGEQIKIYSVDPATGQEVIRPHVLRIATCDATGKWKVVETRDADGMKISSSDALINDDDLTYAVVSYENWDLPESLLTDQHILRQGLAWSALKLGVWQGKYSATRYLGHVLKNLETMHFSFGYGNAIEAARFAGDWGALAAATDIDRLYDAYAAALINEDMDRAHIASALIPELTARITGGERALALLATTFAVEHRWILAQAAVASGAIDADAAIKIVADESDRGMNLAWSVRACERGTFEHWAKRLLEEKWTNAEQREILRGLAINLDSCSWDADLYLQYIGQIWETKPLHLMVCLAKALLPCGIADWGIIEGTQLPAPWRRAALEAIDVSKRAYRSRLRELDTGKCSRQ